MYSPEIFLIFISVFVYFRGWLHYSILCGAVQSPGAHSQVNMPSPGCNEAWKYMQDGIVVVGLPCGL